MAEATLTIFLFYYMQLTSVLWSMKKSHISQDDGSKKDELF